MPLGSRLAPELPFLRRYARAMTGSQQLGDSAVRELLEGILEAPDEFDAEAPVRLELYSIFHRLWRPASEAIGVRRPTALLDPEERHALLLTAVEGFTPAETARIMQTDEETVERLVDSARATIVRSLTARVLIIEDEPVIAMHIKHIVESEGNSVCSIARTRDEAVRLARETGPELVLADINLADGSSGVDAVHDIVAETDLPVVFVTSFPERLLTGERAEPTFLITKPFDESTLVATIGQALMFHRERADVSPELSA